VRARLEAELYCFTGAGVATLHFALLCIFFWQLRRVRVPQLRARGTWFDYPWSTYLEIPQPLFFFKSFAIYECRLRISSWFRS
jgi:hypothetical protein